MKIPCTEIKHPLVRLQNESDDGQIIWWEDADGDIHFWDELPENYPRWTIGTFDSKAEAINRFNKLTEEEDWIIVENNLVEEQCSG